MAISQQATGAQIATVGTEHTLASIADAKTFVVIVDISELVGGEFMEVLVKRKVRSVDSLKRCRSRIFSWLEGDIDGVVQVSVDASGGGLYEVSLRQLNGTGRTFAWAIETPD